MTNPETDLIQIPRPELGRPNDPRVTPAYIASRPELAGVAPFDPDTDVDLVGEMNRALGQLHAQVAYADPELHGELVALRDEAQQVVADTAQTTSQLAQQQESNNAQTAMNIGRRTALKVALIGTAVGLYNVVSGQEAGQVWEVKDEGGAPVRRPELEAASQQQLGALNHPDLGAALASTSLAPRHIVGGVRGGTFDLTSDDTPADGGIVVLRQDGYKLRRQVAPDGVMNPQWWGIVGDGVADDSAAIGAWVGYMQAYGGKYALSPGVKIKGKVHVHSPQKHLTLIGYGASIISDDVSSPVLFVDGGWQGGAIMGLRVNMPPIGDAPPLGNSVQLEPRRTPGGHGILLRHGRNWSVTGCTVEGVSAMGIVFFNIDGYTATGNSLNNIMADGLHSTRGAKRGTITGNVIQYTGDDAIPIVSDTHWGGQAPAGAAPDSVAPPCRNITVTGNTVRYSGARGLVVAGGNDIVLTGNIVDQTLSCNIFILQDNVWGTHGCRSVSVNGGLCRGAGRYRADLPDPQPAVWVSGDCQDIVIGGPLEITDSRGVGIRVSSPDVVIGSEVYVHDNALEGIGIDSEGTGTRISGTVRRNNHPGVVVGGTANVVLQGAMIEHNADAQVICAGQAHVTLMATRLRGGGTYGVIANDGTTAELLGCDVRDAGQTANAVAGSTGTLVSRGTLGQGDTAV